MFKEEYKKIPKYFKAELTCEVPGCMQEAEFRHINVELLPGGIYEDCSETDVRFLCSECRNNLPSNLPPKVMKPRGGKRENAGRKACAPELKCTRHNYYFPDAIKDKVDAFVQNEKENYLKGKQ